MIQTTISDARRKLCTTCDQVLLVTEFHKKKSGMYGVRSKCKECRKQERLGKKKQARPFFSDFFAELFRYIIGR